MKKTNLEIAGAFSFSIKKNSDERGSLVRIFDAVELFPNFKVAQASFVENPSARTLRGLHFQVGNYAETKIAQCVTGKIFDVIVDIDKESSTYGKSCSIYLGPEEEFQGIFIPNNCAHGYLTISDNTKLTYFMDKEFSSEDAHGIKWNDPLLDIKWPEPVEIISLKDSRLPNLQNE